ncbi:hypothetical protein ACFSCV_07445 [Methylopila henanensis]|uniref:Uncharacterized protein n=1 Tax=Methylopila henanensis TaxID=873516 RepID=A0ABW4K843_9HYPH
MTAAPFPYAAAPEGLALSPDALKAANVDPVTGLATDYLNHFNEVVMLLDMLADMPEMREDVLAWAPASYQEHFERSGFSGRAVAIAAYAAAPLPIRTAFERTVAAIDARLVAAQEALADADEAAVALIASARAAEVRPLLARADALIHGATYEAALAAGPA